MYRLKLIVNGVLLALAAGAACAAIVKADGAAAPSPAPPIPSPTSPRKLDEYADISFRDERERLDNFAIELQNDPSVRAVIVAYAGRRARVGEARRRLERARRYLVFTRGIKPDRIVLLDGGHREDFTVELWALPPGNLPYPSPSVDPGEVEIIEDRPTRRRRPAPPARKGRRA